MERRILEGHAGAAGNAEPAGGEVGLVADEGRPHDGDVAAHVPASPGAVLRVRAGLSGVGIYLDRAARALDARLWRLEFDEEAAAARAAPVLRKDRVADDEGLGDVAEVRAAAAARFRDVVPEDEARTEGHAARAHHVHAAAVAGRRPTGRECAAPQVEVALDGRYARIPFAAFQVDGAQSVTPAVRDPITSVAVPSDTNGYAKCAGIVAPSPAALAV